MLLHDKKEHSLLIGEVFEKKKKIAFITFPANMEKNIKVKLATSMSGGLNISNIHRRKKSTVLDNT